MPHRDPIARTRYHANYDLMRRKRTGYRRIDATGTRRRLRALARQGFSFKQVAIAAGLDVSHLRTIANGHRGDRVNSSTALLVAEFYDRHAYDTPPTGFAATRQRRMAERRRWIKPESWKDIDDITERGGR